MARTKTALILSDWQVDLHDEGYLRAVLALAKDLCPDEIVNVGDESDATTIGRWVRDTPEEVEGNLQQQIDLTRGWHDAFRRTTKRYRVCYSNHLDRFGQSIRTRIPAFRTLRALEIEELFGLRELGIEYVRKPFEVWPGSEVLAMHGHQIGLTSANQYSKGTASVHKMGASIVAGHTHRPLLTSCAAGHNFAMDYRFYMNVGCSMDFGRAEYITSKSPEWGLGCGILEYSPGLGVQPTLLQADERGRFRYAGRWYG